MSSIITGDATAVDSYTSRTVSGATNASPIVITTTVPHLFGTGDIVKISQVQGNDAANGTWQITKTGTNTFSLDGSTGSGAYTFDGVAECLTLTPQFTIPGDGDDLDAASVNVALEALADRTQHLALASKNRLDEFTADGTWTCPDNVFSVEVEGCGGGGGGGTGKAGGAATDTWPTGGAGGGGAPLVTRVVAVTPGTTYDVTIGDGGAADTDGESSTFDTLATFAGGGKGGSRTSTASISDSRYLISQPGTVAGVTFPADLYGPTVEGSTAANAATNVNAIMVSLPQGAGGAAITSQNGANSPSRAGNSSVTGFAGGTAGAHGTDASTRRGGGGGGGGGAGPYGAGADGGAGGNGNGAGAGTVGTAGNTAAANTGAGGGGGGAGGYGTTGTPAGGAGGTGGSGRLRIRYVGPQAVVT